MRLSPRQYAEGLYGSLSGKTREESDLIIANFLKLVRKSRRSKDLGRIVSVFEEVFNEKENILPVEIGTAREIGKEEAASIKRFLEGKYPGKKIEIVQKVDPRLLGGIIIRAGDDLWDMSLGKRIRRMKEQIRK